MKWISPRHKWMYLASSITIDQLKNVSTFGTTNCHERKSRKSWFSTRWWTVPVSLIYFPQRMIFHHTIHHTWLWQIATLTMWNTVCTNFVYMFKGACWLWTWIFHKLLKQSIWGPRILYKVTINWWIFLTGKLITCTKVNQITIISLAIEAVEDFASMLQFKALKFFKRRKE